VVGAAGLFELLSPPQAAITINVPIASARCADTARRGGKDLVGAGCMVIVTSLPPKVSIAIGTAHF